MANKGYDMALGLVTYNWGKGWDLPTLLKHCEDTGFLGVELRTTHKHGVEPSLDKEQREAVRKRFGDSPAQLVGLGSNERYDNPDPEVVKKAIEATKAFIICSHDVGGSGVKVKPDSFHKDVPKEKTIEQIGKSLNTLGEYAAGFGQQIRLEVHGQCSELPTIKAIMDVADNDNVAVCWNSNANDLKGEGLKHNFNLVKDRMGETLHFRGLGLDSYPYAELLDLLVTMDYAGWVMIENGKVPKDVVGAMKEQKAKWDQAIDQARKRV